MENVIINLLKLLFFKMTKTIILTGTCGSGKTTISKLLASKLDWIRISEETS